jgi:single-stranded DNA-binding protein
MGNLGSMNVQLIGVRVAGVPTFIPSPSGDVKKHHLMFTVINNRGINSNTKEEMTDEITVNLWGKYAVTGANYIAKGRELNVIGELRSYRHQTGRTRADGKPEIERRVEVLCNRFFFGKDSMKEMVARVGANISTLKASGRDLNGQLTAEELLAVTRPQFQDYNPAIHDASGILGNARIWKKGPGFVGNGVVANAPAADVATLQKQIEDMQKMISAAGAPAEAAGVDPFAGGQPS